MLGAGFATVLPLGVFRDWEGGGLEPLSSLQDQPHTGTPSRDGPGPAQSQG